MKRIAIAAAVILPAFAASFMMKHWVREHPVDLEPRADATVSCGRVVSMSPGITETVFALGLGEQVVGVTRYCTYPPEAASRFQVGGFLDPNYEALLALRPDLILLTPFHRELQPELDRLGLRYEIIGQDTVADIRESFLRLGALCDRAAEAAALTEALDGRLSDIARRTGDRPRPRVLMTTGRELQSGMLNEVYAVSSGSFLSDLLTLAGGVNCVTGEVAEYPALSAEGILQLNPDVIIEFGPESSGEASAAAVKAWRALTGLEAVRQSRVYYLGGARYTIPGPRIVETLDALENCLYPDGEAPPS
ncbi:MAG TPA: helical backbone metal receptor [Candidatus Hydrogenedentes bacterium]|nr:helical backbone metal receptor [Candidatus Hydrogenedentota bacterium]HQN00175.1 helical backbone metal receptor [Candidatus Hydrogenedentota bacterium]